MILHNKKKHQYKVITNLKFYLKILCHSLWKPSYFFCNTEYDIYCILSMYIYYSWVFYIDLLLHLVASDSRHQAVHCSVGVLHNFLSFFLKIYESVFFVSELLFDQFYIDRLPILCENRLISMCDKNCLLKNFLVFEFDDITAKNWRQLHLKEDKKASCIVWGFSFLFFTRQVNFPANQLHPYVYCKLLLSMGN